MSQTTCDPVIRPLRVDDANALGDFFEALAADAETERFFHPHPLTRVFAHELCHRLGAIQDRYFAAFQGDRVIGYSMLRGWDEGFSVPSFGASVHPKWRNVGLGKRLMAHAIEQTEQAGCERLRLTVFKNNERAIAVYRRFGFAFTDKNDAELVGIRETV
jgi:ribosomal protein S18 acetylase RimI-like enzyme